MGGRLEWRDVLAETLRFPCQIEADVSIGAIQDDERIAAIGVHKAAAFQVRGVLGGEHPVCARLHEAAEMADVMEGQTYR